MHDIVYVHFTDTAKKSVVTFIRDHQSDYITQVGEDPGNLNGVKGFSLISGDVDFVILQVKFQVILCKLIWVCESKHITSSLRNAIS